MNSDYGTDFPLYQKQVEAFKTPHGVKIKDSLYSIRCLVSPYNCAVKFCGRLTPHVFGPDAKPAGFIGDAQHKVFMAHKKEIMEEFTSWIENVNNLPALAVNNPFFPQDMGHYGVNVFIYADDVEKEKEGYWYSAFPKLIGTLGDHGWVVRTGVDFYNCTYNHPRSQAKRKPSRIYQLISPRYVPLLIP